ncbi:MAG TPA: polymer-forming cytoskeletal protein [Anaerolineales bacterium]|nr:polymer-forming cytoskeletal protein [Anaerolineales bacterium]
MNRIIRTITLLVLLLLLIAPARPVYAQGGGPGKVVFGDNFTLKSDEEMNGDLVVIGGNVTIENDANLNGNLVVFGGTVVSDGNLNGDVVVFGGQIRLDENAVVAGDVVTIGGQLDKAEGAEVKGEVVKNVSPQIPNGSIPPVVKPPKVNINFNPFWTAAGIFYRAVIIAALAMLVVVFLKPQMEYVSDAIVKQPIMSGGVGLLTVLGGPITILVVALIMIVTLILIPVAVVVILLGALILSLAWLFGMIALGNEVGERFTQSINQSWAPVLTAGFGTFLLMLVGGAIGQIPCLGWLFTFLIGLVGIGAAVLTRFGTRPVQSVAMTAITPAPNTDQTPPAA